MYAIRSYYAEKLAEQVRAERDKATQVANIVVPAEIDKQKVEIDAEAVAEQKRRIAKGEADRITSYNVCYTKLLRTISAPL